MFGLDLPLFLALFAFSFQGTSDFFLKSGVVRKGDPFSIMAMTVPSFILTSAVFGAALGALEFNRTTFLYGPITGVISFIAMNLFVTSLKHGEASVNTMLFRLSFIVTSFLTIGFLGESAGWSKWLGLALATGAVCSVALGGGALRVGSNKAITLAVAALVSYGINAFFFKIAALNGVQAPAFVGGDLDLLRTGFNHPALPAVEGLPVPGLARGFPVRAVDGISDGGDVQLHCLGDVPRRGGQRGHAHPSAQLCSDRRHGRHQSERTGERPQSTGFRAGDCRPDRLCPVSAGA